MPKAVAQQAPRGPQAKAALLDAASELIAQVGWGNVSSRMVAARAGLNNALVHYHFASMDELLRQAAMHAMEQAFAEPTRSVWREGDVSVGMRRALRWLARLDVDSRDLAVLAESLVQSRRDPVLRQRCAEELEQARCELAQAIDDAAGPLSHVGSRGVSTLLLALLDGLLLHRAVDPALDLGPANRSLQQLLTAQPREEVRP